MSARQDATIGDVTIGDVTYTPTEAPDLCRIATELRAWARSSAMQKADIVDLVEDILRAVSYVKGKNEE